MSHGSTTIGAGPVAHALHEMADRLPQQAPLHTFVHHNTLHAFEDQPFDDAVQAASRYYGSEPYQTEAMFGRHLATGRIRSSDLTAVVVEDTEPESLAATVLPGFRSKDFRIMRLHHLFEIPGPSVIAWQSTETNLLQKPHPMVPRVKHSVLQAAAQRRTPSLPPKAAMAAFLQHLWRRFDDERPHRPDAPPQLQRRRDQLLAAGGADIDRLVHAILIRVTAAFLDQGIASWPMPNQDKGLLAAFRDLYQRPGPAPARWMAPMTSELRRQSAADLDAEQTAQRALHRLGIARADWPDYVRLTALSLPGWAGMVRQFETRPDRAPVRSRPARLLDYIAVQLTLDAFAADWARADHCGQNASWPDFERTLPRPEQTARTALTYEAFVSAQLADIDYDALEQPHAIESWLAEVQDFDEWTRRRLLHRAYERHLRIQLLDSLCLHRAEAAPPARMQAIFCIDDRECSARRHLEEVMPTARTFGYAGFFGVAMAWQGLGETRPSPLCPVNITPRHYVTERALQPDEEAAWLAARRRRGLARHAISHYGRGVASGGLVSAVLGWLSAIPLIGRCLFPRASARLLRRVADPAHLQPATRLVLERQDDRLDEAGRLQGYTCAEMAEIVRSVLRTISLTEDFCELVFVIGHGSSNLNNPHEAAYDCGATGGGRGGPNARAFAQMANDPRVRDLIRATGLDIPAGTWFVGCYHDTSNDSMTYYDEDLIPESSTATLAEMKAALRTANAHNAHERCRRFESAPHTNHVERSLRHAEGRAVDLAQPRPECGHATNAYAIVGRRSRTRGLCLDRRAFLVSYDPTTDPSGELLERLLEAVVPVGAGINLEYYFSFVDPRRYGCGSKLPHNITGLLGVMDGHSSDLRTGLPWQMVEIHEPVRLLAVVDAEREVLEAILDRNPGLGRFLRHGWIQLAAWSPDGNGISDFRDNRFEAYVPEGARLRSVPDSAAWHQNGIEHLSPASISASGGQQ